MQQLIHCLNNIPESSRPSEDVPSHAIMAAADVQQQIPSHMRPVPGSFNIPVAKFPPATKLNVAVDATSVATAFVDTFNQQLRKKDLAGLAGTFVEDGYWRDHLALTWAFRTLHTPSAILPFLQKAAGSKDGFRLHNIAVDDSSATRAPKVCNVDAVGEVSGVQVVLKIETAVGAGTGLVKLVQESGTWKIFTLFTRLEELRGFEEALNGRRTRGVEHGGKPGRKNWAERRDAEIEFTTQSPAVLVIGNTQQLSQTHETRLI